MDNASPNSYKEKSDGQNEPPQNSGKFNFSEFVVDFLGALVPGLIFLLLFATVISGPLLMLLIQIKNVFVAANILTENINSISIVKEIASGANRLWVELAVFILIASYVVGHTFFRRDPKKPDKASFNKIRGKFNDEQKHSWVVQPVKTDESGEEYDTNMDNIVTEDGIINVEYPYLFLKEYLHSRKLNHLEKLVPWSGNNKKTHKRRTKFFINMLKIRLQFYFPDRCGTIRRNEGHVRLMSSFWYISKSLIHVGAFGLILLLLATIGAIFLKLPSLIYAVVPTIICIVTIIFSYWSKNNIEKFIHYMRVREILYVLETSYTAAKIRPEILDGIVDD